MSIFDLFQKRDNKDGIFPNYSQKWMQSAMLEDLNREREIVRQQPQAFSTSQTAWERLLWRFDEEIRKRNDEDEAEWKPPAHREHGWYLPNDD